MFFCECVCCVWCASSHSLHLHTLNHVSALTIFALRVCRRSAPSGSTPHSVNPLCQILRVSVSGSSVCDAGADLRFRIELCVLAACGYQVMRSASLQIYVTPERNAHTQRRLERALARSPSPAALSNWFKSAPTALVRGGLCMAR